VAVQEPTPLKTPKFDGLTSSAEFYHQFEAMAGHCKWAPCLKAMNLLTALQGQASDIFHGVLKEATYEETIKALDDHFGDQHLATA
jgi:hypothetical protein